MQENKVRGIVRAIDDLGRFVIPREYISVLHYSTGDLFFVTRLSDEELELHRVESRCCLCNSLEELKPYKGKYICNDCLNMERSR